MINLAKKIPEQWKKYFTSTVKLPTSRQPTRGYTLWVNENYWRYEASWKEANKRISRLRRKGFNAMFYNMKHPVSQMALNELEQLNRDVYAQNLQLERSLQNGN